MVPRWARTWMTCLSFLAGRSSSEERLWADLCPRLRGGLCWRWEVGLCWRLKVKEDEACQPGRLRDCLFAEQRDLQLLAEAHRSRTGSGLVLVVELAERREQVSIVMRQALEVQLLMLEQGSTGCG